MPLPSPSILLRRGDENTAVRLGATLGSGGVYDALDYLWSVTGGTLNNAALSTPTWRRPSVTADTTYDIDLVISARGTDTNAAAGSVNFAIAATRRATVRNVPRGPLWLAGARPDNIYNSLDNGATWSTGISGPSGQDSIEGIAIAPNGDIWLVGTAPDKIYKSTNNGATWGAAISIPSGQTYVTGIAVAPER